MNATAAFSWGDWIFLGTWLVTGIGWLVANGQAKNREIRKEIRGEVDGLNKQIADIVVKARTYYALPSNDPLAISQAATLNFDLTSFLQRAERMEARHAHFDLSGVLARFFGSVTDDPFGSASRVPIVASDPRLLQIEADANLIVQALELGFDRKCG